MSNVLPDRVTAPPPRDEWLLVIDMQRAFADPQSDWSVAGFWELVPRIERLLPVYAGRVILTRYVPPHPLGGAWSRYFEKFPSLLLAGGDPAWDLMLGASAPSRVETRATFGKWDEGIATIVGPNTPIAVCGVATECCVLSTVLSAVDDGRSVRVIEDACAGATPQLHQQALALLVAFDPLVSLTRSDAVARSS